MYAVTTQDRCATPPRSPTIRGSAVLTIRLSSMASKIASSSPGSTIITSRGARNCPPETAPVAGLAPTDPEPSGPVLPNSAPLLSSGSATRLS